MKNRSPTELAANGALRYGVYDKDGTLLRYEYLKLEDNPTDPGTILVKETLLKDVTASLFGLGADAVPDDVLAFLGKYNQHWWERRGVSGRYEKVVTAVTDGTYRWVFNSSNGIVYSYSDSVSISTTGVVSLGGTVKTFTAANVSEFNTNSAVLVGRYFTASKKVLSVNNSEVCLAVGTVYYIPSGATFNQYSNGQYTSVTALSKVTSEYTEVIGEWEYLLSTDRNAYPDSGESDGFEWKYLGVPFENAVTAAKVAVVSYVGTGVNGVNNPNTITLDFATKYLIMGVNVYDGRLYHDGDSFYVPVFVALDAVPSDKYIVYGSNGNAGVKKSTDGKTFTWYADSAQDQLNMSSAKYYVLAIG